MPTVMSTGPQSTPYQYVGDVTATGDLQLTLLARSFELMQPTNLDFLFPRQENPERLIVIERVINGIGIMPRVRFGVPNAGNYLTPSRIERRYVSPAAFRQDDFLDQALINQMRRVGSLNEAYTPAQIVADRVAQMVAEHQRTVAIYQAMVLLGGINYIDARTGEATTVSTQIPVHNFFRYNAWDAAVAANASVGGGLTAATALVNTGRRAALLFQNAAGDQVGVPWSRQDADVPRALRLLKQYLWNTNKNRFTDIVMSGDLYTMLLENEVIKAYATGLGILGQRQAEVGLHGSPNPFHVTWADGELRQIAGLNIVLVDSLYRDPETNTVKKVWPPHKVALVARAHFNDPNETLGRTQFCVGESPDGTPGMWMREGPDQQPPSPPGRTLQMGDAFLPFAKYPEWIALVDVAEPDDLETGLFLRADIGYGTF
jgi:hypothetical protein